ncbi:amidohydrolase [Gallaecimonas sp. GXIMD4217]|uniref:amidohydrolase n=1 Tax=Gallaecimonas sp. GXIMD4217 TaxID=3131927 RepID=UPI00311ADAA3
MKRWMLAALALVGLGAGAETVVLDDIRGYGWQGEQLVRFSRLIIEDGKVKARGGSELAIPEGARVRDLDGRTVLPGLIDAHGHVMGLGFNALRVDLAGTTSLAQALDRVRRFARKNPAPAWITGRGWNQELWPDRRMPRARDLALVEDPRPIWLRRVDGHAGWANQAALKLAGITAKTKAPEGGAILRDKDGRPTGVLVDNAMALVERLIPEPSEAEKEAALTAALQILAGVGLTSVHDAGVDLDSWQRFERRGDRLSSRLHVMLAAEPALWQRLGVQQPRFDDRLQARAVKLYADGALGSRGAALLADYHDKPGHRGLMIYQPGELESLIRQAAGLGFQVNVHAIGDAGNRRVLDAFAALPKDQRQGRRHRIEHAQVVALEDIPRFKALDIIASVQPSHATSDMNMAENRLGKQRIRGAYAWQRFLDAGVAIAAGSDFPVESANPFYGLYAAVSRQDHQGKPRDGWYGDQALTREQALYGFTRGAAFAAFMEDRVGALAPGQWADLLILDRDYFQVPVAEIWQLRPRETWLAGEVVHVGP